MSWSFQAWIVDSKRMTLTRAFFGSLFTRPTEAIAPDSSKATHSEHVENALEDSQSSLVSWLRENGRYLSPNGSGDLILGVSILLRNWIAVHIVLSIYILMSFLTENLIRFGIAQLPCAKKFSISWFQPWYLIPLLPLCCLARSATADIIVGFSASAVLGLYGVYFVTYSFSPAMTASILRARDTERAARELRALLESPG